MGVEQWAQFGLGGLVLMILIPLFAFWVKASRSDMRSSQKLFAESQEKFIEHLTMTGQRQTEAIVASSVATQQSVRALEQLAATVNRHDERAALRHDDLVGSVKQMERIVVAEAKKNGVETE